MRLALNFYRVDPSRGGAETYVRDLCHRLVQDGHAVDLHANSWAEDALPAEVRCVPVEATGFWPWQRIWSFAENSEAALKAHSYDCTLGFINTWYHDIIIPQGGVHGASIDHNALRFPPGLVRDLYRMNKWIHPKTRMYAAIERRQYGADRAMRVIAVSRMVQGHLERYHHVPAARIRVIPNAIDADRLALDDPATARRTLRKDVGLDESALVALFVGHNFWLKGLKPLLLALAARPRSARPIHLLVCGAGKPGPFQALAARLGLSKRVHFLGRVPDIRPAFWASDFLALPTYYDPCSLVVFEALACGLPVITTAYNGAGELITEGQEGFVIPAPDARADFAMVLDRMTDDHARRAMSGHAMNLGRAQSFDRHFERLMAVVREVAASKTLRGPHASMASSLQRGPAR